MIETTAPISIDYLKKYFEDKETRFLIDYKKSDIQGEKFLVYLSNLDVPCDVKNYDDALVEEYLKTTMLVSIPSLENIVTQLLYALKDGQDVPFKEHLLNWEKKIDSLTLYNMYMVKSNEFKEFVESFPKDDTKDLKGINFVSLLKNEATYGLFEKIKESNLTFFSKYFNDYMFKGNSLYSFWANKNNPMFLLTWGIAEGQIQEAK